jgi:hypothetical protein
LEAGTAIPFTVFSPSDVLCKSETSFVSSREEHGLTVFQNKVRQKKKGKTIPVTGREGL